MRSAEKIHDQAKLLAADGDEEKSYVLYMTFINIGAAIRKTIEYKKSKVYFEMH